MTIAAESKPLTIFQQQCLEALAKFPNGHATAADIGFKVGKGQLAVTSALRSLLGRDNRGNPDVSEWVVRLGPRDQWGSATWCIKERARLYLGYELLNGSWVRK